MQAEITYLKSAAFPFIKINVQVIDQEIHMRYFSSLQLKGLQIYQLSNF